MKHIEKDSQPLILVVITPLMKRLHRMVENSKDLVFIDSSSNMEEYNFRIFLVVTQISFRIIQRIRYFIWIFQFCQEWTASYYVGQLRRIETSITLYLATFYSVVHISYIATSVEVGSRGQKRNSLRSKKW